MKKVRIVLNILIVVLMLFQFLGYIANWNKKAFEGDGAILVGYYIEFNFSLILSFILFVFSGNIKRKLDKIELNKIIDSIGRHKVA